MLQIHGVHSVLLSCLSRTLSGQASPSKEEPVLYPGHSLGSVMSGSSLASYPGRFSYEWSGYKAKEEPDMTLPL